MTFSTWNPFLNLGTTNHLPMQVLCQCVLRLPRRTPQKTPAAPSPCSKLPAPLLNKKSRSTPHPCMHSAAFPQCSQLRPGSAATAILCSTLQILLLPQCSLRSIMQGGLETPHMTGAQHMLEQQPGMQRVGVATAVKLCAEKASPSCD